MSEPLHVLGHFLSTQRTHELNHGVGSDLRDVTVLLARIGPGANGSRPLHHYVLHPWILPEIELLPAP